MTAVAADEGRLLGPAATLASPGRCGRAPRLARPSQPSGPRQPAHRGTTKALPAPGTDRRRRHLPARSGTGAHPSAATTAPARRPDVRGRRQAGRSRGPATPARHAFGARPEKARTACGRRVDRAGARGAPHLRQALAVARDCPSRGLCSLTCGRRRPTRWGLEPRRQAVPGSQVGEDTLAGRRNTLAGRDLALLKPSLRRTAGQCGATCQPGPRCPRARAPWRQRRTAAAGRRACPQASSSSRTAGQTQPYRHEGEVTCHGIGAETA